MQKKSVFLNFIFFIHLPVPWDNTSEILFLANGFHKIYTNSTLRNPRAIEDL